MTTYTSRALTRDDIPAMQAIVSDEWRDHGPRVDCHIGDIAWGLTGRDGLPHDPLVWHDDADGSLAGWSWVDPTDELLFHLAPAHTDGVLLGDILEWFAADTRGGRGSVWAMTSDTPAMESLATRGYHPGERALVYLHRSLAETVHKHPLPDGFTAGHVETDDDVAGRVIVHRAAFAPSRVTVDTFNAVRATAPYRPELDIVVRDPDGVIVATCLCWYDEASRSAEFEPVSVLPDREGQGLGRAVCAAALRALQDAGAEQVVVYADTGNSRGFRLYERLDFTPIDRAAVFVRDHA